MTSTSRGTSRFLLEYDNQKSQEWLRRRKLRLAQVRKQSNEIARSLREKIMSDEKLRLDKYDRMSEANFRDWKAEKMDELESKLRCALDEFGDGYKLAEAEPDPDIIREEINRRNFANAQRRGVVAQQEEQRVKRQTEQRKMSPINRKKLTRKKEDLRSALVRCVTVKKNAGDAEDFEETLYPERSPISRATKEKYTPEKAPVSRGTKKGGKQTKDSDHPDGKKKSGKGKRKKGGGQKSCLCKTRAVSSESFPRNNETVWINLNEIQSSSTGELGVRLSQSESLLSQSKSQKSRPEGTVEFYDFTSRFHRRTFREFPHLVERVDSELREPNAIELAQMEDEHAKVEARKREETEILIQDRGMEALRREKINRDYNNLVSKLEELYKKEKVLKTEQKNQPSFLHMSEERLSDRLKARQKLMDSKFEKLYYQATSETPIPDSSSVEVFPRQGGGDWADLEDGSQTALSLSPSNFKHNTPVKMEALSPRSTPKVASPRGKVKKNRQLLEDIEKTLQEGRELRKTVSRNQVVSDVETEESQKGGHTSSESEREASRTREEKPERTTRSQECQTENLKPEGNEEIDVSLPVSTSTCYKSPPSVLRSYRVQKFLEYLEGLSEPEDSDVAEEKQTLKKKIDKLMYDLLRNSDSNRSLENEEKTEEEEKVEKSEENLCLEYYVAKLLTMSRECIANLSISSENISTPNMTDSDLKEAKCNYKFTSVEEIRHLRLNRADSLEETIGTWKRVLDKDSEKDTNAEPEDVPDCVRPREPELEPERTLENVHEDPSGVVYTPKMRKFEEITKKCSERILELSEMLEKVRKDKEKLLSSASGASSLSLNKDGKDSVKDFDEDKTLLKCFVKKNNLEDEKSSLMVVADSQKEPEESFESWPDVMEELLRKKILTSPFKWSDGEPSSDLTTTVDNNLQPSSIETVIGNFRKEISKIKPFTLSDSNSSQKPGRESSEESYRGLSSTPRKRVYSRLSARGMRFQEETSVESINQALTSLGLNWAKSFLRKNEESKAINSSSNSERKSSDSEEDPYP